MATITSVTGQLFLDGTASINGSGFGASQGNSIVLIGTVGSQTQDDSFNILSWSDTAISIIIPGPQNSLPLNSGPGIADINPNSYFVVIVAPSQLGARSPTFAITAPPPVPGAFQVGQYVVAQPGANSFTGS